MKTTRNLDKLLSLKHFLREVTCHFNICIPFLDGGTEVDIHKTKYTGNRQLQMFLQNMERYNIKLFHFLD